MKTMTIHRALAELKTIDSRIEKAIQALDPVGVYQEGRPVLASSTGNVYADHEKFTAKVKADIQQVEQLIKNKGNLKKAIVESNSKTKIKLTDGREMSVAEAITEKAFIGMKKTLVDKLEASKRKNDGNYKVTMEKVEKNLQTLLEQSVGKDQTKVSQDDIEAIRKPFLKANELHIIDPITVEEYIAKKREAIQSFETEIDAVLSEANAVTIIEIED